MVRIVEYFADKASTDVGDDILEIDFERESRSGVEVSDTGELSSNNELGDFPSVGMSPDYCSDVSAREKDIDLEESMEKCSANNSDRNYKKGDGKKDEKYENCDVNVYKKEKSYFQSKTDILVFKQEKGDECTLIAETKPVEMTNLELLEQDMIQEEFGKDENNLEWTILDDIDTELLKKRTVSK